MVKLRSGLVPLLTAEIVESLRLSNVRTVLEFLTNDDEAMSSNCSLPLRTIVSIRSMLKSEIGSPFVPADAFYSEMLISMKLFSTGIDSLDCMLDGGILGGEILELVGSSRTGKTQICFCVAATNAAAFEHSVLFIDASGSFSSERVYELMKNIPVSDERAREGLNRITLVNCFDLNDLMIILTQLHNGLKHGADDKWRFRLIIIDSLVPVILQQATDPSNEGQGLTNCVAKTLTGLVSDLMVDTRVGVVLTNSVTQQGKEDLKPSLGRLWTFTPTMRIMLTSVDEDSDESVFRVSAILTKSTRTLTNQKCILELGR